MTAITEREAVLRCPWGHVHLWPAGLRPYPSSCMAKVVAPLPHGEWSRCGKGLHVSRYLLGEENGSDAKGGAA